MKMKTDPMEYSKGSTKEKLYRCETYIKKAERSQINSLLLLLRHEKEDITTNSKEIQLIVREFFENLYSNKLENQEEMHKYLDVFDLPKLNQEDINHLSRSIKAMNLKQS
jgi:hypothetical protein